MVVWRAPIAGAVFVGSPQDRDRTSEGEAIAGGPGAGPPCRQPRQRGKGSNWQNRAGQLDGDLGDPSSTGRAATTPKRKKKLK